MNNNIYRVYYYVYVSSVTTNFTHSYIAVLKNPLRKNKPDFFLKTIKVLLKKIILFNELQ